MSMITELVRKLRAYSSISLYTREYEAKELLNQAADTIEELSEKVAKQNMERSSQYYGGGWILCSERMPEEYDSMFAKFKGTEKWVNGMAEKISDDVNVTVEYKNGTKKVKTLHTCDGRWEVMYKSFEFKVIAWQPLPLAYEPKED